MYTVLIAEDEMLVRMGLTASVMWEKLDMKVVGDAADGQKAYELFCEKKPDILITDLSMSGMDGLALIRKIRESKEPCAVIVVTCLDRFDMLHEAMELGVTAYLVKATMSMADIEKALVNARDSLGAPRPRSNASHQTDRVQSLFTEYLFGENLSCAQLRQLGEREGFDVLSSCYLFCARLQSPHKISWQFHKAFRGMIGERLKNQHVIHVLHQDDFIAVLFTRTPKVHDMIRQCDAFSQYIQDSFGVHLNMAATMDSIALEALPGLLRRIRSVCLSLPESDASLLWFDAQGRLADTYIKAEFEHLREALWQVNDYSFAYSAVQTAYQLEDAFASDAALFQSLAHRLADALWDRADVSAEQRAMLEKGLEAAATPNAALQYICRCGVERLPAYRREIRMVISFVIRNPAADLGLKKAAQLAALHPQYLSTIFKKEVGVNYSDFVCTTRLLSAQRILLMPDQSIQKTSEALGFSDQAYFCRKFKQLTGKTPAQWRRSSK